MFIILIGSVARNEFSANSDIDICRININKVVERKPQWPNGPIVYIDYDIETFNHLYEIGSLFLLHILCEGILLEGDKAQWEKYKKSFKVKENFQEEIDSIIDIIEVFDNIDIFGNKYLSMYSNLFTIVKNFSIFFLANSNKYVFDKKKAVKEVFGDFHFDLLYDSYNYFERGVINEKWKYDSKEQAMKILNYYLINIKEKSKC